MLSLNVLNETNPLKAVVLGIAKNNGPIPAPEECYDPSSLKHVLQGTYPLEKDMMSEIDALEKVLSPVLMYRFPCRSNMMSPAE